MNILVLNCGSSSLKYSVLEMPSERQLARGEAQRIGPITAESARIVHQVGDEEETVLVEMPDHATAFEQVIHRLDQGGVERLSAIGHRFVHGGQRFLEHRLVDDEVVSALEEVADLAPIHNPPAIALLRTCRERFPELAQALVFDTVFHKTIPEPARTYALPQEVVSKWGLRKYGFHGISHQYVTNQAATMLECPLSMFNAVSCHLGSGGASLCAVVGGCSMDNTMGFSSLQGLIMSTRCGDVDPSIPLNLLARRGGDAAAIERLLYNESGVLGLSGLSSDIRDVLASTEEGGLSMPAQVYLWRIRKYLGAYLTVAAPASAVVFTDTIGETVPLVRRAVCSGMEAFGLQVDCQANAACVGGPCDVATEESSVRILVIPTNEELAIARSTHRLVGSADGESEA